ncbi:MAG: extracellular solute-binding protein [Rhodospirillales bacterium]
MTGRLTRRRTLGFLGAAALQPALWRPAVAIEQLPLEGGDQTPIQSLHALAMHGEPKYGPDFPHFDYANPDAPKGGRMVRGATGGFDSFSPFIAKGHPAGGITLTIDELLVASGDEAFSKYGLLVESMRMPEDRSWIEHKLRRDAHWHDGTPMTAEDIVWSFEFLVEKGHPQYRFYYASVEGAEALAPDLVRFRFAPGENRELALIIGQLPVLPKHYWTSDGRDPTQTTLTPPLASGPYRIADFEPNRYVEYERVVDYWARDLPVNRGQHNFDRIRFDYYLDQVVERQAAKSGRIDLYQESRAAEWVTGYDIPAVRSGALQKLAFSMANVGRMQGFCMNQRRDIFKDRRVRHAIAHAFDFEWTNRNLFFSLYERIDSYFFPTELGSRGLPDAAELAILEPYRGRIPDEVFTQVYKPPETDGSGWPRANLETAFGLLAEAGWEVRDLELVNVETGQPFRFEILLVNKSFERIVLPFQHNLRRLGMDVRIRTVDQSQYINRVRAFDFDMTTQVIAQSLSPGNEQRDYWSSSAAERPGSRNWAGIADPVVDALIDLLIAAPDRESLIVRTRALDRVLLWGHYTVPQWSSAKAFLVAWDKFGWPETAPLSGIDLATWWFDEAKAEQLQRRDRGSGEES